MNTNALQVNDKATHRVGLTVAEIYALICELADMKATSGLSRELASANVKLMNKYNSIDNGTVQPDYVPNGRKRESAVNLDSLGATEQEKAQVRTSYVNPMSEEILDIGEELNRKMLAEMAASGLGNVVITERRSAERLAQDSQGTPTDNDSVHTAFMQSHNINPGDL